MDKRNMEKLDRKRCDLSVNLIKDFYYEHVINSYEDSATSISCKQYIKPCRFHTALFNDVEFALKVLSRLQRDEVDFILSALVDYSLPLQSKAKAESPEGACNPVFSDFKISEETKNELMKRSSVKRYQLVAGIVSYGGNVQLLTHLFDLGLDVMQKDDAGNTILHLLVDISDENPHDALMAYEATMASLADNSAKIQLAFEKNDDGETALDLACARWLPDMMHALLNTKGVYKFLVAHNGTHNHFYYDITEFEVRKLNSGLTPLHHLSVVPEKNLKRLDHFQLMQKEPFATWIQELFFVTKNLGRAWFVGWTSMVLFYITGLLYIVSKDPSNAWVMNVLIIIVAAIGAISDAFTISSTIPYYRLIARNIRRGHFPLALASLYRSMQMFFLLNMIVTHSLYVSNFDRCADGVHQSVFIMFQVANITNGIIGLLFFTQLNNRIGHYLIVIEKVAVSVSSFVLLSGLFLVNFSLCFQFVTRSEGMCPSAVANSTRIDSLVANKRPLFSGFLESLYETFLLGIGVAAPKDWYFTDNHYSGSLIMVYVLSLIFNTVVLLNLMIAIMNQRMVDLVAHKKSLLEIAQLAVYLFVEERLIFSKWIFRKSVITKRKSLMEKGEKFYLCTTEPCA